MCDFYVTAKASAHSLDNRMYYIRPLLARFFSVALTCCTVFFFPFSAYAPSGARPTDTDTKYFFFFIKPNHLGSKGPREVVGESAHEGYPHPDRHRIYLTGSTLGKVSRGSYEPERDH